MATAAGGLRVVADDAPYLALWDSFARELRARNRSPYTLKVYRQAAMTLRDWLAQHGRPVDPLQVTRDDIRGLLGDLQVDHAPSSVRTTFAALSSWFAWMEREGEMERSPMYRMSAPTVPEKPMHALTADELGRLLKVCEGPAFEDRRDMAMLRLFADTGLRRAEMASLALEDVDLDGGLIKVTVKGGATVLTPFGAKAARDLDRYLRVRSKHRQKDLAVERGRDHELVHPLWLTPRGGISSDGVHDMMQRRCGQAGIAPEKAHVHAIRHGFAHSLKAAGASDEDVQRLGRWRDSRMVRRYGAALSQQRAWETHRRLSPGDRL